MTHYTLGFVYAAGFAYARSPGNTAH